MCEHGTDMPVTLNHPREHSGRTVVMVDACIAEEVQALNDAGVWTLGCCCGHGKAEPEALIHHSAATLAEALGYQPEPYNTDCYRIVLRSV